MDDPAELRGRADDDLRKRATDDLRKRATDDLRKRAVAALSRREYSRQELARKLEVFAAEDQAGLSALLDDLQAQGWLSDARYVESRLHARQSRYGSQKILHELRAQGVAEALIAAAGAELKATELERAGQLWRRKFSAPPATAQERARQIRFMQSRGFDLDVIYRLFKMPYGEQ